MKKKPQQTPPPSVKVVIDAEALRTLTDAERPIPRITLHWRSPGPPEP